MSTKQATPEVAHAINRVGKIIMHEQRESCGDEQQTIVDLIADTMHYCDARGLDWYALETQAIASYTAEVSEED